MEKPLGRAEIENLAERIEAFAAGLDDAERDAVSYLLDAARRETAKAGVGGPDDCGSPVATLLAGVLKNQKVHPGFSIQFFPWIRHKSPIFDNVVVKPSN